MRFKFETHLPHQEDAIAAVVDVFDTGENAARPAAAPFALVSPSVVAGNELQIDEARILKNVQAIQKRNGLPMTEETHLATEDGVSLLTQAGDKISLGVNLSDFSIEMETGTGKTYVYLRTIYQLNRKYGLTKFIILVPSVAIREGVLKTIAQTEKHFKDLYSIHAHCFGYDSGKLSKVREFAQSIDTQVMVMTIQSFNNDTTIMRQTPDRFNGESPISMVAATRPVVIMDEPQNMESELSQSAIGDLKPLFKLRYSATHKNKHNLMYQLTPADAYREGLVKKIAVYGVQDDDTGVTIFRVREIITGKGAPRAKAQMEVKNAGGKFEVKEITVGRGEDLARKTKNEKYAGLYVANIDARAGGSVELSDGSVHKAGERIENKEAIFRTQIRETIKAHFEKQSELGDDIKVLSLFFIDKVDNYVPQDSLLRTIFNEEFKQLKARSPRFAMCEAAEVHAGYFASKKEKGVTIYGDTNGKTKADKELYDLIMKNKERLLSFDEPVSFIFSHSALKEGWDNPNIFQICTLRETRAADKKRQEIGRGLRLPVDVEGNRIYDRDVNILTVIANESYRDFVSRLQAEYTAEGYRVPPEPSNKRREVNVRFRKEWTVSNQEFQELWRRIQQKTRYNIALDTDTLVQNAVCDINEHIQPKRLAVRVERVSIAMDAGGAMHAVYDSSGVGERVERETMVGNALDHIARETGLTRKTVLRILGSVENLDLLFVNPEEYVRSVIVIISNVLNLLQMNEGLRYEPTGDVWDLGLFADFISYEDRAVKCAHAAYDYVAYDSDGERQFAENLDASQRVTLFTKLPSAFVVDTPLGTYNPDWAIVMKDADGRDKLYLVRETKFVPDINNLRPSELQKIKCGEKHFAAIGVDFRVATREDLSDLLIERGI